MFDMTAPKPTMSTREIADLTGKEHAHVMRDTRTMLEALKKDAASYGSIYKDAYGRDKPCFNLDRELTMTLVSGYDIPLRHRVVTRLTQLEAQATKPTFTVPTRLSSALRLAAEQAELIEEQTKLLEQARPAVEFLDRYVETKSTKSLREVAKVLSVPEREFIKKLEDDGILFRQSGCLLPFAHYQHRGLFEVKTGKTNNHAFHQTRFTPHGVAWIAKRILQNSPLSAP